MLSVPDDPMRRAIREGMSPMDEATVMADVAFHSLEGAGFKVVRKGSDA